MKKKLYRYSLSPDYLKSPPFPKKAVLLGRKTVLCGLSPSQWEKMYVADCQFPNGDVFPVRKTDLIIGRDKK